MLCCSRLAGLADKSSTVAAIVRCCYVQSNNSSSGDVRSGAALLVLRDLAGPFREVEGLFTVLMCVSCRAVRSGDLGEVLAYHDPGQPWLQWGCPLEGCRLWVVLPEDLEGHTAAEHPGWVARYELVRPLPDQLERHLWVPESRSWVLSWEFARAVTWSR
jgi:hypothetical protein